MSLTTKVLEKLTVSVIDKLMSALIVGITNSTQSRLDFQERISSHLIEVSNWSKRIQFFGMGNAKDTDIQTIKLALSSVSRKFQSPEGYHNENDLLRDDGNYLLLGDPGSGKTTTLKRLSRKLLLSQEECQADIYQYPILIRLREISENVSLSMYITDILGIKYEIKDIKDNNGNIIISKYYIGEKELKDVIPSVLNSTNALLLLDGLDEVSSHYLQKKRISEIEYLARKLSGSKIILACRSGDYTKSIEGFDLFEICPLSLQQIREISKKWIENYKDFLDQLEGIPCKDMADRPLILCQLLIYFSHCNSLPKQPSFIYKKTIKLFLEEWDNDRNVKRASRYSHLDVDLKLEFLSELSFLLTYKIKTKEFCDNDLIDSYHMMHQRFSLPREEAEEVAKEIETHTGIIVKSIGNNYEFSHLSIQEYLCANYIVRSAISANIKKYIIEYSPPLAVAVSLSTNSSEWFSGLILRHNNITAFSLESISSLLTRLLLENPYFKSVPNVGFAIISIISKFYFKYDDFLNDKINQFLSNPAISKSISLALKNYIVDTRRSEGSDQYYFILKKFGTSIDSEFSLDIEYNYPKDFSFNKEHIDKLFSENNLQFHQEGFGYDDQVLVVEKNSIALTKI